MKKAIIFDLYDTLITVHDKTNPYLYLLSTCKEKTQYDNRYILNHIVTDDFTTEELILYFKLGLDIDYFHSLLNTELDSAQSMPTTYKVLTKLSEKYRLFLLSNLATPYKGPYYSLGLKRYFEKAFFSCDEKDKKPNASFYQKVLDYSGLEKKDLIMIGDNPISDIKAAHEFGIDSILKEKNKTLEQTVKDLL